MAAMLRQFSLGLLALCNVLNRATIPIGWASFVVFEFASALHRPLRSVIDADDLVRAVEAFVLDDDFVR